MNKCIDDDLEISSDKPDEEVSEEQQTVAEAICQ